MGLQESAYGRMISALEAKAEEILSLRKVRSQELDGPTNAKLLSKRHQVILEETRKQARQKSPLYDFNRHLALLDQISNLTTATPNKTHGLSGNKKPAS